MMYLNLFISSFNKTISFSAFVVWVLVFTSLFCLGAISLRILDLEFTDNDLIRSYQTSKLVEADQCIDTIFVGDSSLGNAINSKVFDEIVGTSSLNLALTGGWGVYGSAGMTELALKNSPCLKNVVIFQSLYTWNKKQSSEAILEFMSFPNQLSLLGYERVVAGYLNFREYLWATKLGLGLILNRNFGGDYSIDYKYDYLEQIELNYPKPKSSQFKKISDDGLHEEKYQALVYFNSVCQWYSLNCILTHGPIYKPVADESSNAIEIINSQIERVVSFKFVSEVMGLDYESLTNNQDHVVHDLKDDVTGRYASLLMDAFQQ